MEIGGSWKCTLPQVGAAEVTHVKLRQKPVGLRKLSNQEEINKRLSLPADLKLPDNFITRQAASPTLEGPITRSSNFTTTVIILKTIHPH